MGLDITAYSKLTYQGPYPKDSDGDYEGQYLYTSQGCDNRLDGPEGLYLDEGKSIRFRAGSYSGYNWWRDKLSLASLYAPASTVWDNTEAYAGKPFFELINYSDCEGAFGPITSAKLAADFEANREAIGQWVSTQPEADVLFFKEKYEDWAKAFTLAAQGGAVILH